MYEPSETLALLRGVHLPNMADDESRILAARVCGWKPRLIAERLFVSERTVRRALERLVAEVCAPSGVEDDIAVLVLWFGLHLDCDRGCTARAMAMIDRGEVFPAEAVSEKLSEKTSGTARQRVPERRNLSPDASGPEGQSQTRPKEQPVKRLLRIVLPATIVRPHRALLACLGGALVLFGVLSASADSQYMEVTGCVGSGYSYVYADSSALGVSDGCSGAYTLIVSTVYSGSYQYQCPLNWSWGYGDSYCVWTAGVELIYGTHRMYYNGNYSSYVYTSDY